MLRLTEVLQLLVVLKLLFATVFCKFHQLNHTSQKELVKELLLIGDIRDERVREVITQVDRRYFIEGYPYFEKKIADLGYGATFNTPQGHALVLRALQEHLVDGKKVLEIGSGSGYSTVCMAIMVGEKGYVVGIEHIPELIEKAKENIRKSNYTHFLEQNRIRFIEGDGRLGAPQFGPYDAIYVGAALPLGKLPEQLVQQLSNGGRMIITTDRYYNENNYQDLLFVDKMMNGELKIKNDSFENCYLLESNIEFLMDKATQLNDYKLKLKIESFDN